MEFELPTLITSDNTENRMDEVDHAEFRDDRILVSVQMYMDPKLAYVPTSLLNFVIRTVMYTMWCMLLRVAERPVLSCGRGGGGSVK